ncbi:MAG: NTP transferase domain-containing protein [Chthoniobacterales bacterium]
MKNSQTNRPLRGLVLAGGKSRRMGKDKSLMRYGSEPQWLRTARLLENPCQDIHISIRADQDAATFSADQNSPFPFLPDALIDAGPLAGLLTAFRHDAQAAWLVVACDLPLLNKKTLDFLLRHRNTESLATAFLSANDGLPEPLCAIYEPAILPYLENAYTKKIFCPRKVLIQESSSVTLLKLPDPLSLENANTPEDFDRLSALVTEGAVL